MKQRVSSEKPNPKGMALKILARLVCPGQSCLRFGHARLLDLRSACNTRRESSASLQAGIPGLMNDRGETGRYGLDLLTKNVRSEKSL